LGFLVNDLLVDNFPRVIDIEFTAGMENDLDEIEEGKTEWAEILKRFYTPFEGELQKAEKKMLSLRRDGLKTDIECELCGSNMVLKWGRNGPFLSCSKYPECKNAVDYRRNEKGAIEVAKTEVPETEEVCEKCGKPMIIKKGKYGPFLACSGYPECKNTKPLSGGAGEPTPDLPPNVSKTCESCGSPVEVKRSRMGNLFIACTDYPKCKSARPFPTGVDCPKENCDGELVERSSKKGIFFGCSNFPKCRFTLRTRPVKKTCPDCGSPYLVESKPKSAAGQSDQPADLKCPNKSCDYTSEPEEAA
jgi:DNA topoisomerase-1